MTAWPPLDELLQLAAQLLAACGHAAEPDGVYGVLQERFLRRPGQERWQLAAPRLALEQEKAALALLERIGSLAAVVPVPEARGAEILCVHGGTYASMRSRALYARSLIESGALAPRRLLFLAGDRPLDAAGDSGALEDAELGPAPAGGFQTEADVARALCERLLAPLLGPGACGVISAPMLEGGRRRPTTGDAVRAWAESGRQRPRGGERAVAVSSQPYVRYQDAAMRLAMLQAGLDPSALVCTVGPAAAAGPGPGAHLGVHLDNLARVLHAERALKEHMYAPTAAAPAPTNARAAS
eukprot:tig00000073_g1683.t1